MHNVMWKEVWSKESTLSYTISLDYASFRMTLCISTAYNNPPFRVGEGQ